MNIIACDTQPVQNLRVLRKHGLEHKVEWAQWAINLGLAGFERTVAPLAGQYCLGDTVRVRVYVWLCGGVWLCGR